MGIDGDATPCGITHGYRRNIHLERWLISGSHHNKPCAMRLAKLSVIEKEDVLSEEAGPVPCTERRFALMHTPRGQDTEGHARAEQSLPGLP